MTPDGETRRLSPDEQALRKVERLCDAREYGVRMGFVSRPYLTTRAIRAVIAEARAEARS